MRQLGKVKKFIGLALLGVLLASLVTSAAAVSIKQIKERGYIRVAVANEKPFGYVDESGNALGFGPETAKKVLSKMGVEQIQWVVMPFDSLMDAVNDGRVDMVAAGQAILPKRCKRVLFSRPNTSYGEGLLVLSGNPMKLRSYANIADHPKARLGVVAGATQAKFARKAGIASSQIVMLKSNEDAVDALVNHKIDVYGATQFSVAYLAQNNKDVEAAKPYPKKPFAIDPFKDPVASHKRRSWGAFSFAKNSTTLRKRFDKNLKAFQNTKAWLDILKRYGLDQRSIDAIDKKTTTQLCQP